MKLTLALSALLSTTLASQEPIGSFSPITQVTDHVRMPLPLPNCLFAHTHTHRPCPPTFQAAIDLDQAEIEALVAVGNFGAAQSVYTDGANSKAVADLALATPSASALVAGSIVDGIDTQGNPVSGKVYANAPAGSTSLQVQYATSDAQDNHVGCRVGGSSTPFTEGCFAGTGTIRVNNIPYDYSYTVESDNFNARTIQGFSTGVDKHRQFGTGDFYPDFQVFQDYYGSTTYADKMVTAALTGTNAGLTRGNQNYSGLDDEARVGKSKTLCVGCRGVRYALQLGNTHISFLPAEGVKKGTAYLNIFMYVIRELEDAIDDCELGCDSDECNDDAVHALDEAVAFYTGSTEGNGANGNLLYALAEKRCDNFKTCGANGAVVNNKIFVQFKAMQDNLLKKECGLARSNKEVIASLMYVPMVQGALRYAYFQGVRNDATAKSDAEGAAFMAAVLPQVHQCSERDAQLIYDNLSLGNTAAVDFKAVKKAFENNYSCMDITCELVGGLSDGESYFDGAGPCGGSALSRGGTIAVAGVAVGVALLFAILFMRMCRGSHSSNNAEKQVEMGGSDNIA